MYTILAASFEGRPKPPEQIFSPYSVALWAQHTLEGKKHPRGVPLPAMAAQWLQGRTDASRDWPMPTETAIASKVREMPPGADQYL